VEHIRLNRAYIILVNWNGWCDTIECLESLFRSDFPDYRVIVSDNGSDDGSTDKIKAWAEGRLDSVPCSGPLRCLSFPPVAKPVAYAEYTGQEAEQGGEVGDRDRRLIIIRNSANLGFAGGNNVALRYALACNDFDHVWLLNNDTVAQPDSLSHMVARMKEKNGAGMCGSTILFYERPDKVQALGGGWHCKWIGLPWHFGRIGWRGLKSINLRRAERWMNYVEGASLLVPKQFLEEIGLMCEDYFLYFEETDWAIRAHGRYSLAYAPESIVYHKVGASIGTSSKPWEKSYICDYFSARNRLFFTRRYYPLAFPVVYLALIATLSARVMLGKWDRVKMISRQLSGYYRMPPDQVLPKIHADYYGRRDA